MGWDCLQCGCYGVFCADCVNGLKRCHWCTVHGARHETAEQGPINFTDWTEVRPQNPTEVYDWPTLVEANRDWGDEAVAEEPTDQASGVLDTQAEVTNSSGNPEQHSSGVDNEIEEGRCWECSTCLAAYGVQWRLCVCGARCCVSCAEQLCRRCGSRYGGTRGREPTRQPVSPSTEEVDVRRNDDEQQSDMLQVQRLCLGEASIRRESMLARAKEELKERRAAGRQRQQNLRPGKNSRRKAEFS